jgi:long-chain-fatty-acid--CoA ligase ACSBG
MSEVNLPKLPEDEYACISSKGLEYILNHFDPKAPEKNFLWTADYRVELPVRVKKSGPGSEKPYTLIELWKEILPKFGDLAALTWEDKPDHWTSLTYKQYFNEGIRFAKSLITLGIPEYTAINIIGFNSP